MKTKIENLSQRLKSLRLETNIIRSEIINLVEKHIAKHGEITVPVNPVYAKKEEMSEADKLYNSVILDSYPVSYETAQSTRDAYIAGVKLDADKVVVVKAYDREWTNDHLVEFRADEIVNMEPFVSFLMDFMKDPDEPEK